MKGFDAVFNVSSGVFDLIESILIDTLIGVIFSTILVNEIINTDRRQEIERTGMVQVKNEVRLLNYRVNLADVKKTVLSTIVAMAVLFMKLFINGESRRLSFASGSYSLLTNSISERDLLMGRREVSLDYPIELVRECMIRTTHRNRILYEQTDVLVLRELWNGEYADTISRLGCGDVRTTVEVKRVLLGDRVVPIEVGCDVLGLDMDRVRNCSYSRDGHDGFEREVLVRFSDNIHVRVAENGSTYRMQGWKGERPEPAYEGLEVVATGQTFGISRAVAVIEALVASGMETARDEEVAFLVANGKLLVGASKAVYDTNGNVALINVDSYKDGNFAAGEMRVTVVQLTPFIVLAALGMIVGTVTYVWAHRVRLRVGCGLASISPGDADWLLGSAIAQATLTHCTKHIKVVHWGVTRIKGKLHVGPLKKGDLPIPHARGTMEASNEYMVATRKAVRKAEHILQTDGLELVEGQELKVSQHILADIEKLYETGFITCSLRNVAASLQMKWSYVATMMIDLLLPVCEVRKLQRKLALRHREHELKSRQGEAKVNDKKDERTERNCTEYHGRQKAVSPHNLEGGPSSSSGRRVQGRSSRQDNIKVPRNRKYDARKRRDGCGATNTLRDKTIEHPEK